MITRLILSFLFSIISSILFGQKFIDLISNYQKDLNLSRKRTPDRHKVKAGTPIFGGIMIMITSLISCFIFSKFNYFVTTILLGYVLMSIIGFIDDYKKIKMKDSDGLIIRYKFLIQYIFASIIIAIINYTKSKYGLSQTNLWVPYYGMIDFGFFYYFIVINVIVGTSNAINLTDGLDTLASKLTIVTLTVMAIITIFFKNFNFAQLNDFGISDINEVSILILALIGSLCGFIWFNSHPASIFMGDFGSLGLGGFISTVAILLNIELILPLLCLPFVIETISVIIQVTYYKLYRKKFFLIAPIHHHFELLGYNETKIVSRFTLLGIICGFISIFIMLTSI